MKSPEAFIRRYERAQGWSEIAPLMHEDVCVTFTTGTHKGKESVGRVFEHNLEAIQDDTYRMRDRDWVLETKHCAICLFRFEWTGTVKGEAVGGSGRGTIVLVRDGDDWLLATEHLGPEAG
jgi:hypothetical protein